MALKCHDADLIGSSLFSWQLYCWDFLFYIVLMLFITYTVYTCV